MSVEGMNCNQARDLLGQNLARDGEVNVDVQMHLKACSSCSAWSHQMNEIATVASSLPQFDVSEALTQNILNAVEADSAHEKSGSMGWLMPALVFAAVSILFVIETHESVGGIISWAAGLAVMYSISILVSSRSEAETA